MSGDKKNITINESGLLELLDLVGRNKSLFDDKDHASEGELLKKAWFNHVLVTLEKLDSHVDQLQDEVTTIKQQVFKDMVELRDKIRSEMQTCQGNRSIALEKLELSLTNSIKELSNKMPNLNDKDVEKIENRLKLLEDSTLVTKTKLSVYIAIGTVISTGVIQATIALAKHLIS